MKKSSYLRGRGLGRGVRIFDPGSLRGGALVIGVVFVLIIVRVFFPDTLAALLTPLWRAGEQTTMSVGKVETFFTNKSSLAAERDRLANENIGLQNENSILTARTEDLVALLGTRTEVHDEILASVLARPPISPYDVLITDRGAKHGVLSGALVFGNGGVPVGTIAATTDRTSRVLLYSAPDRETSAWIGVTRIPLTLTGEGSGAFSARISRDAAVLVGDAIYITGAGALPVGTVSWIQTDPSATKAVVHIRPIVNPFSITWVTISSHGAL